MPLSFSLPITSYTCTPNLNSSHPIIPSYLNSEFSKTFIVYLHTPVYWPFSDIGVPVRSHFSPSQFLPFNFQSYNCVSHSSPLHFSSFSSFSTPHIIYLDQTLSCSTSTYSPTRCIAVFASLFHSSTTMSLLFQWSLLTVSIAASLIAIPLSMHSVIQANPSSLTIAHLIISKRPQGTINNSYIVMLQDDLPVFRLSSTF